VLGFRIYASRIPSSEHLPDFCWGARTFVSKQVHLDSRSSYSSLSVSYARVDAQSASPRGWQVRVAIRRCLHTYLDLLSSRERHQRPQATIGFSMAI
jgi:hypothetical protein